MAMSPGNFPNGRGTLNTNNNPAMTKTAPMIISSLPIFSQKIKGISAFVKFPMEKGSLIKYVTEQG